MPTSRELVTTPKLTNQLARKGKAGTAKRDTPSQSPQVTKRAPRSLAELLKIAVGSKHPPSILNMVTASHASGSKEHITVETVFTEGQHPFDSLFPDHWSSYIESIGTLRVLWIADNQDGDWFIVACPANQKSVYHLLSSIHSTDRRWQKMIRALNATRGVIRPFLNHQDFENIGSGLSAHGDVEVVRVTGRSALNGSSDSRSWKQTPGQLRPSHTDAILEMERQGFSVRTLMLSVGNEISVHLRRMAGATYYSGSFKIFLDKILAPLAAAASERRKLLVGRQRTKVDSVHPVTITLPSDLLATTTVTNELVQELFRLPKTTVAIFHRNPYLHLTIADETDGSNFDLMVTESSSIDVYPGYRATSAALSRLVDYISERFGGEKVEERSKRVFSLEELSMD
ncbi:hypothetical protein [Amycolatopsis japonica]